VNGSADSWQVTSLRSPLVWQCCQVHGCYSANLPISFYKDHCPCSSHLVHVRHMPHRSRHGCTVLSRWHARLGHFSKVVPVPPTIFGLQSEVCTGHQGLAQGRCNTRSPNPVPCALQNCSMCVRQGICFGPSITLHSITLKLHPRSRLASLRCCSALQHCSHGQAWCLMTFFSH